MCRTDSTSEPYRPMTRGMRILLVCVLVAALPACGNGAVSSTTVAPETASTAAADASTATTAAGNASPSTIEAPSDSFEPVYDVFLAAVAETIEDTRFADVALEEPELTVAAGLAICEAIVEGENPDAIVAEFVSELAGGQPELADEDQLILTGAILGAAEIALCPDGS